MTNNDILRRVRYILDYGDAQMIAAFDLGGRQVTRAEVSDWLKRDEDPDFKRCDDAAMTAFLDGVIVAKRGAREGAERPLSGPLTNNAVFVKLKIALNLRADEVVEILAQGGHALSKHELSAFFRRADHRQYRECQDQVLRKFLRGLQLRLRGAAQEPDEDAQAEDDAPPVTSG